MKDLQLHEMHEHRSSQTGKQQCHVFTCPVASLHVEQSWVFPGASADHINRKRSMSGCVWHVHVSSTFGGRTFPLKHECSVPAVAAGQVPQGSLGQAAREVCPQTQV